MGFEKRHTPSSGSKILSSFLAICWFAQKMEARFGNNLVKDSRESGFLRINAQGQTP
jgi:hypothetical protein